MRIVFVGIDLAKNVFAVHGVNEAGKAELVRPKVARAKLGELMRCCRDARSGWRRAAALTTGRGGCRRRATPSS